MLALSVFLMSSNPLALQVPASFAKPKAIELSANQSPSGHTIAADSTSLLFDGKRVIPAMGEFHYARYPESQWRTELLKMKAGGIDVVASYVFWIHHEEIEGKWDWAGRKNLRKFVQLCGELGLKVVVRGGPWAHGECRNGGFPDWVVKRTKTRTDDPAYLAEVSKLYTQISHQIEGLTWTQGGPVIGFQVENELYAPGTYFDKLRTMAEDAGIHVPIFTRTGWPAPKSPPKTNIFPMFGGYPIGFWDRGFEETADKYSSTFIIGPVRDPDQILQGDTQHPPSNHDGMKYPYLCCEIGGGMATSYHRRVVVQPDEIGSLAMVKIASGCNMPGYYMYHGGTNPDGVNSYLNETQATGYWNDVPVKTYDFQAPLGEFGQVRDHYHILRRMHLFLQDFGSELAAMPLVMPSAEDALRWSLRTDGSKAVIFVNNFQRLKEMPAREATQFSLAFPGGEQMVPANPISIPANSYFFMPVNWEIAGAKLQYATAQPICKLGDAWFFAEIPGIKPEFRFDRDKHSIFKFNSLRGTPDTTTFDNLTPGHTAAITVNNHPVFLLSAHQSLHFWRGHFAGQERVVICEHNITFDGDALHVFDENTVDGKVLVYPPVKSIVVRGRTLKPKMVGAFAQFSISSVAYASVNLEEVRKADASREIHMGSQGVAEQPSDADFDQAAVWKLTVDGSGIIRVPYVGDAARLYVDGKLVEDNFYTGRTMEFDSALVEGGKEVLLKVLPLRKDAPVYFNPGMRPDFRSGDGVCLVRKPTISPRVEVVVRGK